MKLYGFFFTFLLIISLSFANENKNDGIKVYKRLIPADVLRGKSRHK